MGSFGSSAAQSGRRITHPAEWWNLYGSSAPNLKAIAVKILSQTASSSGCERNWSTFGLIHTKQRNRLGHERLQKLVFVHYNMRLRVKNVRTNVELNTPQEPIDLTEIFLEEGDENPLYEWVKEAGQPVMDEPGGRPSRIIASEMGIDVDTFMATEVVGDATGISISSISNSDDEVEARNDTDDELLTQPPDDGDRDDDVCNNDDEGNDDDDDDDNTGGDGSQMHSQEQRLYEGQSYSQSQAHMSPFTGENQFDHATQDIDHGSRLSSGKQKKTYARRKHRYGHESESVEVDSMTSAIGNISIEDSASHGCAFPAGYQGSSYPNYTFGNIQPSGWILPNEHLTSGYSNETDQSVNSSSSSYYPQRCLEYPAYPRLGVLVDVPDHIYERYVKDYKLYYYSMMTWRQYCNYIEHQYFEGNSSRGEGGEEARRSMWC